MINQDKEFWGIDKESGFSIRVLILSAPAGLIFLILGIFDILSPLLALVSYCCILFFNTVFLMPMSTEILQIKKYLQNLTDGTSEEELCKKMTEKETRDLTEAINSIHKFWVDKAETFENRTLSDAAVLDTLPDPLLMINKSGFIIGANLSARKLFKTDLNNKELSAFIDDTKVITLLNKVLTQEIRQAELSTCLTTIPEKPKFFIHITTIPWFAKGDVVAVASFYDLNKALKFEQMQQDFVANASHELRTPLSIISGFIETLQTSAKDDKKAQDKFLHIMSEQTIYMSALIENLLSLSKIELSLNTPPNEKVNVNTIIKEVKTALELKAKEQKINIKTELTRLPQITADTHQITQILQNLIDNAIKYATPETTITITTSKIDHIPQHQYYNVAEGNAIEIDISNFGVTISPEDIDRLTERFYRLQEHKNKNIRGTGLGLSIATQIIKRHRGNMVITSKDNLTTFKIYLPI